MALRQSLMTSSNISILSLARARLVKNAALVLSRIILLGLDVSQVDCCI